MRNDPPFLLLILFLVLNFPLPAQNLTLPGWISGEEGFPPGWDEDLFSGLAPGWYSLSYLRDRPGFPRDVTVTGRGCFFLPRGFSQPPREDLKSLLEHLLKSQSSRAGAFTLHDLHLPASDQGPRSWTTPGGGRDVLQGLMTAAGGTGPGALRWRFRLETWVKAPRVLRAIPPGGTFGPQDLSWEWVKSDSLLGPAPEEVEIPPWAKALVSLSPGTILRTTAFRPEYAVTRNEGVLAVFFSGNLRVEVEARALGNGNTGDEVELHTQEGRRFRGRVTRRGTVEVRLP